MNDHQGLWALPDKWVWTNVGEIYSIVSGGTPSTKVPTYWNGDIPWITSADIFGLKDIRPRKSVNSDAILNSATNLVPSGSIIVVTRVSLGRIALTNIPLCFSQDSQALIGTNGLLSPDYALYYLSKAVETFKYHNRGTTIAGVTKKQLSDLPFALPPLPEQHRIVAKIEELFTQLDAGVAALTTALAQLKRYRQSVLKAAFEGKLTEEWREKHLKEIYSSNNQELHEFTEEILSPQLPKLWKWTTIGNISHSMKNGIYRPKEDYSYDEIACLRMYNIDCGKIVWKKIKRMKLCDTDIEEYLLKEGDILVNRVNSRELVGKSAVITANLEKCIYESKNIRLRIIDTKGDSKYVNYWFLLFSSNYFNRNAQQTVGMASINQAQLGSMPIPYPTVIEQSEIVAEIERRFTTIDETEKTIKQSLAQAERLRQSILKRAFEGKLIPQDPRDEPASLLLEQIKKEKAAAKTQKKTTRSGKSKTTQQELI